MHQDYASINWLLKEYLQCISGITQVRYNETLNIILHEKLERQERDAWNIKVWFCQISISAMWMVYDCNIFDKD